MKMKNKTNKRIAWSCKIGSVNGVNVPSGGDSPMRRAVEKAYYELTGEYPDAIFSGWGDQFTDIELDTIHNELKTRQEDDMKVYEVNKYKGNLKKCYEAGKDCGVNGATLENCHFGLFASPEMTKAWEDGKNSIKNNEQ